MSELQEEFPGQLLHQACIYDNIDLLETLLSNVSSSQNVNAFDRAGRSILYTCISNSSIDCCQLLLAHGADVNLRNPSSGLAPIHQATKEMKTDFVQLLIRHGADVFLKDEQGKTAFDYAVDETTLNQLSLCAGAIKEKFEAAGAALLKCLSMPSTCDVAECMQLMRCLGAERTAAIINSVAADEDSFLYKACLVRRIDVVNCLIEHGSTGQYNLSTCRTVLHEACSANDVTLAETILKKFPELIGVRTTDSMGGRLPIHVACVQGNVFLVKLLLDFDYPASVYSCYTTTDQKHSYRAPFDLNDADIKRLTPLFHAVMSQVPDLVEYLLDYSVWGNSCIDDMKDELVHPVDVNYLAVDNLSPLYAAVQNGCIEIARLLLDHHADVNQQFQSLPFCSSKVLQSSACLIAAEKGDESMLRLLLKYGVWDEDKAIAKACHASENSSLLPILLQTKVREDAEHKNVGGHHIILAAHATRVDSSSCQKDENVVECNGNFCESSSWTAHAKDDSWCRVAVNWHDVLLTEIKEEWLFQCACVLNPHLSCAPQAVALATITSMDISHNQIPCLPACVLQMPSLVVLRAEDSGIEQLPLAASWRAPLLRELALAENKISMVPAEIFCLPSLERLDLKANRLVQVPGNIWHAPMLKELDLSSNLLECLLCASADSGRDSYDSGFSSSSQSISGASHDGFQQSTPSEEITAPTLNTALSLPSQKTRRTEVADLYSPAEVNVWSQSKYVQITAIEANAADSLANRQFLQELNLSNNRLTAVPKALPCLAPQLKKLDLSKNYLTNTGHPSLFPPGLISLNMSNNAICRQDLVLTEDDTASSSSHGKLPAIHGNSSVISTSSRHVCQVLDVPCASVWQGTATVRESGTANGGQHERKCEHGRCMLFEHLRTFQLANNMLSSFEFTMSRQHTDSNGTTVTEEMILFPALSHLDLSKNSLTCLQRSISCISSLSQLNISDNPIKSLPPEIGSLSQLWNIELKNCPLEGPLATMVEENTRTSNIIGFLKSVLQEAKPYTSMKLMFVGTSNIGKTTFLNELKKAAKNSPDNTLHQPLGSTIKRNSFSGEPISTVGVDIGSLVIRKQRGEVTFRTWDFGGQEEYYATHQYFLTRRSLYLVLWKITDGAAAVRGIKQWLVNIQTRAPDSPVLIIGTHLDQLPKKASLAELQSLIRSSFMDDSEPEKRGLPHVHGHMEISCKNSGDIKKALRMIYDTAWSLLAPGSKTLSLLDQKIPAVYMQLATVVNDLAEERRLANQDPVLTSDDYQRLVEAKMVSKFQRQFRDLDELKQGTQFLHDNGVMLHFQDVTLNNLYFLDPKWLCGILAKVVTVREANPLAKNGLMNVSDIRLVYPDAAHQEISSCIINLLSKFEVGLLLQTDVVLIPSLLPKEYPLSACPVKIRLVHCRKESIPKASSFAYKTQTSLLLQSRESVDASFGASGKLTEPATLPIALPPGQLVADTGAVPEGLADAGNSSLSDLRRLYFFAFIPSGFWSRLLLHLINDKAFTGLSSMLIDIETQGAPAAEVDPDEAHWQCWDTGARLVVLGCPVLVVRQSVAHGSLYTSAACLDYNSIPLKIVSQSSDTREVNTIDNHVIELVVPSSVLFALSGKSAASQQGLLEMRAKFMSRALYHIEALLEDWYPRLGLRFLQQLSGVYLVTRAVPCPWCVEDALISIEVRKRSISEFASCSIDGEDECGMQSRETNRLSIHCLLLDELIHAVHQNQQLSCPSHGELVIAKYAPDIVFSDVSSSHLGTSDVIWGSPFAKGAFGVVHRGHVKKLNLKQTTVAIKTYEPVDLGDGPEIERSLLQQYHADCKKWQQSPVHCAVEAYFNARNEIDVMLMLNHPSVVSLVGIIIQPLAMVLPLAPQGSMKGILELYAREGKRLTPPVVKRVVIQIADALAYLHREKVIYRDLKADNVLVWSLPLPAQVGTWLDKVDVKLADYGVSRRGADSVSKGFAGTEGYMAPEIVEHNGEETYTDKVDCYSFGMFLYEIISLKRPFEDVERESIKGLILKGGRPKVTTKEAMYPSHFLDLLSLCWQHAPTLRPSAQDIVDLASTPQFDHLVQAVESKEPFIGTCILAVPHTVAAINLKESESSTFPTATAKTHRLLLFGGQLEGTKWHCRASAFDYHNGVCIAEQTVSICDQVALVLCAILAGSYLWLADESGYVHVFTLDDDTKMTKPVTTIDICSGTSGSTGIVGLLHWSAGQGVIVVNSNGDLFVHSNDAGSLGRKSKRFKAGSSDIACSILLDDRYVWLGCKKATIEILSLTDGASVRVLSHGDFFRESVATVLLEADEKLCSVWSYPYPGTSLYRWGTSDYACHVNTDISAAIMTYSRGPRGSFSVYLDGSTTQPPGARQQLRALKVLVDGNLIVATSQGYIVIIDALSLVFIACFMPYGKQSYILRDIITLPVDHMGVPRSVAHDSKQHVITCGRDYQSIVLDNAGNVSHRKSSHMFLLSWAGSRWKDL